MCVVESGFRELTGSDEERAKYAGENTRGWRGLVCDARGQVTRSGAAG